MSPLAGELRQILQERDLHMLFQPILNTREGAVLGYEALVRGPAHSPLHNAAVLFETANTTNMLAELEHICRELAIRRFVELGLQGKLFLNVSPMTLTDPRHPQGETLRLLERYGLPPARVVIELSEHYPTQDMELLARATRHYAGMGFEIAIDDLGAGYSGLRLWSEVGPSYVKIDRHFVAGIDADRIKREFVRFIRDISQRLGCRVIAEGIETSGECLTLQGLGIHNLQGFYLGVPVANPQPDSAAPAWLAPAAVAPRVREGSALSGASSA